MKKTLFAFALPLLMLASCKQAPKEPTLKDTFDGKFLMGVALNESQILQQNPTATELIIKQFNSVVAENCMKCEIIHPEKDVYNFELADKLVDFAEANNMAVIGHTLIWHSQLAPWFTVDENGETVSPEVLKERMKEHITTVMQHFKGRIKGWDVVNEAIEDNGSYRNSPFYRILGEEFIPYAFQCAQEADPDAELYYNDYSMTLPGRRDAVVALVGKLKDAGIRIDAVGMQAHWNMDSPSIDEIKSSLDAFIAAGVKVNFTELDMSVLPSPWSGAEVSNRFEYSDDKDPFKEAVSEDAMALWNSRMEAYFTLFNQYSDNIDRVTLWGLTDGDSWKNDWPIPGRTDYPLLFDRNYQPKEAVNWIVENIK